RTALAMELLGKSGANLLPLASQFGDLRKEAEALGIVMSDEVLGAAADLDDQTDRLSAVFGGLKNNLVSVIVQSEPVQAFMSGLVKLFGDLSKWVQKNQGD